MISVIIPVYNESGTVADVIGVVCTWDEIKEVIVVNDGSTDQTEAIVKKFGRRIRLISYITNKGKGYAVAMGIQKSKGNILLLLDADIVGLSHEDLARLVIPLKMNQGDMTLGRVRFLRLKIFGPRKEFTGERAFFRHRVMPHVHDMKEKGYALEYFLNTIHRNKRMVEIDLPTVFIADKFKKQSLLKALISYWNEWSEVAQHYANGI